MALLVSRACKGCNQLKVRCQPGPSDSSSCARCLQAGRPCVPGDKRRRPRDRIAELEAQVAALSRQLQKQQLGDAPVTTINTNTSPAARNVYSFSSDLPTGEAAVAFLDARVPRAAQQQALDLYVKRLWPLVPCFSFSSFSSPADSPLDAMRRSKPVLFFSIVTFTAPVSLVPPAVRSELLREAMCMFAVELISKPNRRLDTVWSLLVACFFFRAQNGSAHVTVHQLTQMATNMAIDLGLGGAQVPAAPGVTLSSTPVSSTTPRSVPELEAIEYCASPSVPEADASASSSSSSSSPAAPYCTVAARADAQCAWLACFVSASNVAIGVRRPDANAQWTAHHQTCLDELARTFDALPAGAARDNLFLHMVRGERLCQQIAAAVQLCEPAAAWDVAAPDHALVMADLQTAIDNWTAETTTALVHAPPGCRRSHKALLFFRYAAVIYLHESVLHTPTNKLSFGAPYRQAKLASDDIAHPPVTGKHVASLYALKDACLALLDLACSDVDDDDSEEAEEADVTTSNDSAGANTITAFLADAPISFIAKVFHAFFVLAKLHIAVTAPGHTFGAVLRPAELRVAPCAGRLAALADCVRRRNPDSFNHRILACAAGAGDWCVEYEAARTGTTKTTVETPPDEEQPATTAAAATTATTANLDFVSDAPFFAAGDALNLSMLDAAADTANNDGMAALLSAYGPSSSMLDNGVGFGVDDAQWQMLDRYFGSYGA
ncbi:uncharacterized protein SPSK_01058 [Sporothrix schenckii 1099-18]|uniref:Zn(2)-C6 fungal-type domain-containing protein n=2 Tax=Sporothrix schenckii TaxID=29908 RepID=U7PPN0_SPOS1|nr:uncharacterized protein SPSK_01058 [Sporothrix schenckii 1099-18]ERS96709.1 hypothetical protein HMPREF1624_06918 [Sporothrix schenckii ATCC 58251]KJR81430.1 hypothetical protein SPSK_01058 [Sporothrix schenckii 1099-18]